MWFRDALRAAVCTAGLVLSAAFPVFSEQPLSAAPPASHRAARLPRFARAVIHFSLIDAVTGRAIPGYERIAQDVSFSKEMFTARSLDLRATIDRRVEVGSVLFRNESRGAVRIRNRRPFRWMQDDDRRAAAWHPEAGEHILTVIPFSRHDGRGRSGLPQRLRFTIEEDEYSGDPPATPIPVPTGVLPFPTPTPSVTPPPDDESPVKVWANDGGDKVARDELRYSARGPSAVTNSLWDGVSVNLFGAHNEIISFNLVIEAPRRNLEQLSVVFDRLDGPGGAQIASRAAADDALFDYRGRNIELFYTRYLQIRGLSRLGYETYDERHIPARLRRPYSGSSGTGGWEDRPDHDRFYPDIAVPYEKVQRFDVSQGNSQSIWVDIYLPKTLPVGLFQGSISIYEGAGLAKEIPVTLKVRNFVLPDIPAAKTMLYLGYPDINMRYLGYGYAQSNGDEQLITAIRNRHFQMAHRHKISLIDANDDYGASSDRPSPGWIPRLSGALFQAEQGYEGPGAGVGNGVFSIGTYGSWNWRTDTEMRSHSDAWVRWFDNNSPGTDYFLYLIDEVYDFAKIRGWAQTINNNPGPGSRLVSFATVAAPLAFANAPDLDQPCSTGGIGLPEQWQVAANYYTSRSDKRFCFYNGRRPQSGSFMTDDDGIALRQLPWAQYKLGVQRWFYWESTYYNNFQAGAGQTNVFQQARTFGGASGTDSVLGETGWNYSNGDGVLFYPGTDKLFPQDSYGLRGPIASLRLKHWRRGIQDVDYIMLASQVNPQAAREIVNALVPKALWEYGVNNAADPTWVLTDISWPIDPSQWEEGRRRLADIIERAGG